MTEQYMKNSIIHKLVSHMVDKETREWPPKCLTFIYQPIRPKQMVLDTNDSEKKE